MKDNDWKKRLGVVYSTQPDYDYVTDEDDAAEVETLPAAKQRLRLRYEQAGRKGKPVTLVEGFVGQEADLKELARRIKTRLCVGGSVKDGALVLQGDVRQPLRTWLSAEGYGVKG